MSNSLKQYLVPCITEGLKIPTDYRTTVPTACPRNIDHTIDAAGIIVIAQRINDTVEIYEDNQFNNGGYYRAEFFELTAATGTGATAAYDMFYDYNVGAYSLTFMPTDDNIGDNFGILAVPDSICGFITATLGTGVTGPLIFPQAPLLNPAFELTITQVTGGVYVDNIGHIVSINSTGGYLYTSEPTSHSFGIGSIVKFTVPRLINGKIVNTQNITIGGTKTGSSGLAAGKIVRVVYTNNNGLAKTFNWLVEMRF